MHRIIKGWVIEVCKKPSPIRLVERMRSNKMEMREFKVCLKLLNLFSLYELTNNEKEIEGDQI